MYMTTERSYKISFALIIVYFLEESVTRAHLVHCNGACDMLSYKTLN